MNRSTSHKVVVSKAKEYIEQHWRENLTLNQIAAHVFVSPFHFQRVFKKEAGESPKEYLTRIRLEAAVQSIRIDLDKTVFEVGLECGFSSQAVFARAFRQRFGVSATEFRNLPYPEVAKLTVWEPSIQKVFQDHTLERVTAQERKKFLDSISVRRMEPVDVVYRSTTMISEAHLGDEFRKLATRASAYDLPVDESECFGVIYDYPLHTPLPKCRYRVCLGVSGEVQEQPRFSCMSIAGGKYAVFPIEGPINAMIRLSILFFNYWLPESHYQRREHFLLERFRTVPDSSTYATLLRELCVPIAPV